MGSAKPHQALYRRYRSRDFDDVVGQGHVTSTLNAAVKAKRIVHAYLFTGPHGVGKTSVARILAHAVNDLPYEADNQHLDIIEIDAASNRGIDEVRELREKALLSPGSAKFKVYIIDEVHMLTPPAFNALLKLLEEPPAHAIFILATTEVHKVPPTIRSRTQWYAFRPIDSSDIAKRLSDIARREKIKSSAAALELIARRGQGSMRDSIGLLDQLSAEGNPIDEDHVVKLLGLVPTQVIEELLTSVEQADWQALRRTLRTALEQGFSPKQLANQIIETLQGMEPTRQRLELTAQLLEVGSSPQPQLKLELELLQASMGRQPAASPITKPAKSAPETHQPVADIRQQYWPQVLAEIKSRNNSLYAILRLAEPSLDDDTLKLSFGFAFHKQRLDEDRNRQAVAEALGNRLGRSITVVSALSEVAPAPPPKSGSAEGELSQVLQVMGGGELSDYEEEP